MADRKPLTIGYDSNNNASKLVEVNFSSIDLADVANITATEGQVLALSGGVFAPSTITGGGGGTSFTCTDLSACDHGILSGLGDDDHTQYVLSDGTRPMSTLFVDGALRANTVSSLSISGVALNATTASALTLHATNLGASTLVLTELNAPTVAATTSVSSASVSAVALNATNASALNLTGTNLHITNLGASSLTGTAIDATRVDAITEVSSASVKGTSLRYTNATGTALTINSLAGVETLTGGDFGVTVTNALTSNISVSTPSVTGTTGTFTTAEITDLNISRLGPANAGCYVHESDWLAAGTSPNGFGQSNAGTGAGTGQCFDNDVMHPDKGTIGVFEIRSGTDAFGRCFVTTFNNAIAVSSCALSFTSRIAPSGLWEDGVNDGKMCFGIRNGTSNADATYAMEFQYGQGGGQGGTTWSSVVTDNSNSTVSDSGVVVSAQEFQVLQVSCNELWNRVDFFIDGNRVADFNLADHNIPDSRFNRLGLAWAINNGNIYSTSNVTNGNEIFVDWHQIRFKPTITNRGQELIQ
tara:strand:+ start:183 stop:1772 length:1590 start_codon:yes stop_codon:yes gene_type:complete